MSRRFSNFRHNLPSQEVVLPLEIGTKVMTKWCASPSRRPEARRSGNAAVVSVASAVLCSTVSQRENPKPGTCAAGTLRRLKEVLPPLCRRRAGNGEYRMAKVIERSKKPVKDPKEVEYYVHYTERASLPAGMSLCQKDNGSATFTAPPAPCISLPRCCAAHGPPRWSWPGSLTSVSGAT